MSLFNEEKAERVPQHPDKIALTDADTIAYAVCSVCEYGDDEAGYQIDLNYAKETAISKIQGILEATGCGSIELHFTSGKNFRYSVDPNYKSNRLSTRYPEGLNDLRQLLVDEYPNSKIHKDYEADDYVVWAKKYFPDKYILVAVDKDVLNSVAGEHYNYYQNEKYKIKPKWVTTEESSTLQWFYKQVLMGDSGDGIQGIPRCGPKTAEKILGIETDNYRLYELCLLAYQNAGLTEKDLIKNARLVSMHQLNEKGELELWVAPLQMNEVKH